MKKVLYFRSILIIVFCLSAFHVYAFDGNRKGFIIGIGAGFSYLDMDMEIDELDLDSKFGLATSLKIGGGITNQLALYYVRNATWIKSKIEVDISNLPSDMAVTSADATFVTGISGIGITYYFSDKSPSFYTFGAIGLGDVSTPFDDDIGEGTGNAYMVGAGYEFSNRLHIEATFLKANVDEVEDVKISISNLYVRVSDIDMESTAFQVTFNYLWY